MAITVFGNSMHVDMVRKNDRVAMTLEYHRLELMLYMYV